jgi:predicted nucleic acid-binding protein
LASGLGSVLADKMGRVFVDTNVFLRFLTRDDVAKAERARTLFSAALAREIVLETSQLVIAEVVWTLESFYQLPRERIAELVTVILATPNLECPEASALLEAVRVYAERNVDFIDAFHGVVLTRRASVPIATFDRKHFRRFPDLELYEW